MERVSCPCMRQQFVAPTYVQRQPVMTVRRAPLGSRLSCAQCSLCVALADVLQRRAVPGSAALLWRLAERRRRVGQHRHPGGAAAVMWAAEARVRTARATS